MPYTDPYNPPSAFRKRPQAAPATNWQTMAPGIDRLEARNAAAKAQPAPLGPLSQQLLAGGRPITGQPSPLGLTGPAPQAQPATVHQPVQGALFGGAQPGMVNTGGAVGTQRPGFTTGNQPEGIGLADQVNWANKNGMYGNNETGTMSPNPSITSASPFAIKRAQIAGQALNAAPVVADPAKREAYLASRKAVTGEREKLRIARGVKRGERLTDTADINNGRMSMAERFQFQNPQAYAQTKLGEGQLGLAGSRDKATDAFRQAQLAQQAQLAKDRELGLAERSRLQSDTDLTLAGKKPLARPGGTGAVTGGALDPSTDEGVAIRKLAQEDPEAAKAEAIARGATPQQADAEIRKLNPSYGQPSFYQNLVDSPIGSFAGDYVGGRAAYALGSLFGPAPKPPARPTRVGPENLEDKPGDTPVQKRLKAELRAKYGKKQNTA